MIILGVSKNNPEIAYRIDYIDRVPVKVGDTIAGIKEMYVGTYVDTSTVPDTEIENYRVDVDGAESDWLFLDPNIGGTSGVNNQAKDATPTTSQQTIKADRGYTGLSKVTISAVDSSIDANIQAGNIAEGVTILGVEGTFQGGSLPTVEGSTLVFSSGASVTDNTLVLGE